VGAAVTLRLPGRPVRCPRCSLGGVVVREVEWRDGAFRRRSVWADEPLRCTERCTLTGDAVIRLLLAVDRQPAYQLPLLPEDAGGAAA
jgi:hypothetical protein